MGEFITTEKLTRNDIAEIIKEEYKKVPAYERPMVASVSNGLIRNDEGDDVEVIVADTYFGAYHYSVIITTEMIEKYYTYTERAPFGTTIVHMSVAAEDKNRAVTIARTGVTYPEMISVELPVPKSVMEEYNKKSRGVDPRD